MVCKAVFPLLVIGLAGCAIHQDVQQSTSTAAFVQMAPQQQNEVAIIKNSFETVIYAGNPYGESMGNEWEVLTYEEPAPVVASSTPLPPVHIEEHRLTKVVHFAFNRYAITPATKRVLDQLPVDGVDQVNVMGHTDAIGTNSYNDRLSVRRAQAVRDFLTRRGVPASKITLGGEGKRQPAASNRTSGGRAFNRRVVINLVIQQDKEVTQETGAKGSES